MAVKRTFTLLEIVLALAIFSVIATLAGSILFSSQQGWSVVRESSAELETLQRLDRIAGEERKRPAVLLEVNVSGEASKAGVPVAELEPFARRAAACANLDFRGFMTMAPFDAEPVKIAAIFELLRLTRDELEAKLGRELPELSMGMSGDYEIAARHGSTIVRVGTLIFGTR